MKKLLLVSLMLGSHLSIASNEATGDTQIQWFRTHASTHTNAAGLATFKVSEALQGGCQELVIPEDDKMSFSHVLAAYSQKATVQFSYKTDGFPHWTGGCWLTATTSK